MAGAELKFRWGVTASQPETTPVLLVGQAKHLSALSYHDVRCKLEPQVTEEAWRRGIECVTSSPGDSAELWPRGATVASLPARASRHAAPSRAHAITKIVRETQRSGDEAVVIVCLKRDVYASALAVARAYSLYSARTGVSLLSPPRAAGAPASPQSRTVYVEIVLAKEEQSNGEGDECEVEGHLTDGTLSEQDIATIEVAARGVRLAARITDTPADVMNVDRIIEEAVAVARELDIPEPMVIRGEALREKGMGGLYGVGRGSATPPALVCLQWKPPGAAETVAWVGKGIVYDTGGLSIKARTSMVGMKRDCGGAAAVLGAFAAAVSAKPTVNLYAVLCVAENSVGPNATRPDDVHRLYSGRTVEINNTDAEGRLVLSDGVVYAARDLGADVIVDVATLTGAQGTATGKYHAAVLSNSAHLERAAVLAGRTSADLTFPVVYAPELHLSEFRSVVADMKNSVADRSNAQVSCAGLFIQAHLGFDFPGQWLHVDMAAPGHCGERATGYGVALLTVLIGARTQSKLLRALAPPPAPVPAHK